MKVLPEAASPTPAAGPLSLALRLPAGIIGFPHHRRGEVFHLPEQLPFQWLRLHGPDPLHFVVINPASLVAGYTPEIFEADAEALGLVVAGDALVFNIVTLRDRHPPTANLVGPLVVNRRTGAARQLVLANHHLYDARQPLLAT